MLASLDPYFTAGDERYWGIIEPDLGLALPKAEKLRAAVGQKLQPAKLAVWPSDERASHGQVAN